MQAPGDAGTTIGGRYAIEDQLGEGGMGRVYRVRHLQLGKPFALKIISPAFAGDAVARARFDEEARLASSIVHPNVVSVVDFGEDPNFGAYMVMELLEGEPLFPHGSPPMSVRRACDVLAQVTDALDHIHKRGIIHGDVKADNIILTAENAGPRRRRVARILDFGLAGRAGGAEQSQVSGSPHYLAPERARGGPPSPSGDVYALGVLSYLLLTGTLPFDGSLMEILMAHIDKEPEPPSARRGEAVDEALEALVMRAMAKDPAVRHPDISAFRFQLNTVMDMLGIGQRRSPAPAADDARRRVIVSAFDRSSMPQVVVTADGKVTAVNNAFAQLVGAKHGDGPLEGRALASTALAEVVPSLVEDLRRAVASREPCETRVVVDRPGGKSLALALWIAPTIEDGKVSGAHLTALVQEL